MNRLKRITFLACLALCVSYTSSAQQQPALYDYPTDPNARDLLILTEWFEGEFNNEEQLWYEADQRSATPDEDKKIRLHVMHRRLDLPKFGEHVFYVEEYKENNPDDLVRQRLVIFSSDLEKRKIRMQQGFFKDPSSAKGAQANPDQLADLTTNDVFFLDECDVYWQRRPSQYVGAMTAKACLLGKGEQRRYSVHNLTLSKNHYWRVDSTRLVQDDSLFKGHPEDQPYQLRRAYPYLCEASFRGPDNTVQKIENIRIHSQGGSADITREYDDKRFSIRLRDKQYPYYATRPDFMFLSIKEKDAKRSLFYSIHDVNSRRLGINGADMGIHCHRVGYDFREELIELVR